MDPDEGRLARILPEEIEEAYPGEYLEVEDKSRREDRSSLPPQRSGEIWRSLFWAVLALLAAESFVARYFGGQRVRMGTGP